MSDLAQLTKNTPVNNSNLICLDGENLYLLNKLRPFLEEYNLATIENDEGKKQCLYQIICGEESVINSITSSNLRECRKRLLIVQNVDIETCKAFSKRYNAKVAKIGDKALTSEEVLVVFGLLFSSDKEVVDLSPKILERSTIPRQEETMPYENKKITQTAHENKPPLKQFFKPSQKKDSELVSNSKSWNKKGEDLEMLIKKTYTKKDSDSFSVKRIFLPFRYAFYITVGFVFLHVFSLFLVTMLSLGVYRFPSDTVDKSLYSALVFTVISGKTITKPLAFIPVVRQYNVFLDSLDKAAIVLNETSKLSIQSSVISGIGEGLNYSPLSDITEIENYWSKTGPLISLIEGDLKNLNSSLGDKLFFSSSISSAIKKINTLKQSGDTFSSLIHLYPEITTGDKTYLVLFQNSNEIRPTGGFIGSIGLLSFSNGTLTKFEILDVFDVDGQLRGHVDPPNPIRAVLNQEHWYLRDSNWSPNYVQSADQAAFFLTTSIGTHIDGVITINLPFLQQLLKITGPITIQDTNQTITETSVDTFLQDFIKENSFAGSTAKKDLLKQVNVSLIQKLFTLSNRQKILVANEVSSSLKNKNILLFTYDQGVESELVKQGWAGAFPPRNTCDALSSCFQDLFAVVEANLGVNKVNANTSRNFSRASTISQNELTNKDTFLWNNTSPKDASGSSDYRMYTRFYYPTGTSITSVTINDQKTTLSEATTSATPLPYTEMIDEFPGLLTLGIAINVPAQEKTKIEIDSSLPMATPPQEIHFVFYKQPGVQNLPVTFSINGAQAISSGSWNSVAKNDFVTYNTSLQQDESLFFKISTEEL